jgi:hypothetical protein
LIRSTLRAALLSALLLPACDRESVYGRSDFTENVTEAYDECDKSAISFLTAKHDLRLAFEACGSNHFANVSWSPDGTLVYFQLTHGGHILVAEEKRIETIPTETPAGPAAWLRDGLLAIPLKPLGDQPGPAGVSAANIPGDSFRLALFDRGAATLQIVALPLKEPDHLGAWGDGRTLILTGIGEDGVRRPYHFDPATGKAERAVPTIDAPGLTDLVYVPEADLVAWSDGKHAELVRISDGSSVKVLDGVKRAVPHFDGRYVALEVDGAPISVFDQTTWKELSPEAQERERKKTEQWMKNLPEWAPREASPPELQILDLQKDEIYRITAWYGEDFEWLRPRPYWTSQILWGVEGKQLKRNVAFTDLREKLRMFESGDVPFGMERVSPPGAAAPAPAAPADPPAAPPAAAPADPPAATGAL